MYVVEMEVVNSEILVMLIGYPKKIGFWKLQGPIIYFFDDISQLEQAQLEQAQLEQAQLEQAQLEPVQLEQAQLEQTQLEQAQLEQG